MTYGWAILVVMIVGVVLWQLGVFNTGQNTLVVTGLTRIPPLKPSIAYSNSSFSASFTNNVGTTIVLNNITLNETISDTMCTITSSPSFGQSVKAGGVITVTAAAGGCPAKASGESYDLLVAIQYTTFLGEVNANHTETGNIIGQGEA